MPDDDARSAASASAFKAPLAPPSVAGTAATRRSSVASLSSTTSFPRFPFDASAPSNPAMRNHSLSAGPADAYSRHRRLMEDYVRYYGGRRVVDDLAARRKQYAEGTTEAEILARNHRFLREEADDALLADSWEQRLAKRYYDRLFKEYAVADLQRYKEGRIAMRWRTEKEVVSGKGQFECANVACAAKEGLASWEVNFGYVEAGEKKSALVKLRLCKDCSVKLHWKRAKEREAMEKRARKEERRRRRERKAERRRREAEISQEGAEVGEDGTTGKRRRTDDAPDAADRESDASSSDTSGSDAEHPAPAPPPDDGPAPISSVYSKAEASRIWSQPRKAEEAAPKSREEEFEDFFESLFQ
ncbi:folate-sensitive fragile site protein Fra10Ac1-domain-containing protein [Hyaloraphidium curvatum]|nr:folate-sensitive fragile site protein Fra10Ac1-domain-containing protein [Hyaloraphidium curvatum]